MKFRKKEGITLITLVMMIIVLIILASVATYTGISTIKYVKFTKIKSQMEIMQTNVNSWYDKLKIGNKDVLKYGLELSQCNQETLEKTMDLLGIYDTARYSYRYFTGEYLDSIGIDGIDYDFLIDVSNRDVILFEGIKYKDKTYYTTEDFEIGNVEVLKIGSVSFKLAYDDVDKVQAGVYIYDLVFKDNEKNNVDISKFNIEYQYNGSEEWITVTDPVKTKYVSGDNIEYDAYIVPITTRGTYKIRVSTNYGSVYHNATIKISNIPKNWKIVSVNNVDGEWYSYLNVENNKEAAINKPVLEGNMKPISYNGTTTGSKWANAMTSDGSMWVWIPRFAYKITQGYNSSTQGKIEIAFLDKKNNFLNGERGELVESPSSVTYTEEGIQNEWLLHPAFSSNASYGGGFKNISGIWIAKFETSGEGISQSGFKSDAGRISLRKLSIGELYTLARSQLYGEQGTKDNDDNYTSFGNSHILKNSEYGALSYLAYSAYGTNTIGIAKNSNGAYYTGGDSSTDIVYTTNVDQSTTLNAHGVYDISGGTYEYVASYINNNSSSLSYGGNMTTNNVSSKYKTIYGLDYNSCNNVKGDAVYETSTNLNNQNISWNSELASYPAGDNVFFVRSGYWQSENTGLFYYNAFTGNANDRYTCRLALVFEN